LVFEFFSDGIRKIIEKTLFVGQPLVHEVTIQY